MSPHKRCRAERAVVVALSALLLSLSATGCHAITGLDDLYVRDDAGAQAVATATATSVSTGAAGATGNGGAGPTVGAGGTAGAGASSCDLDGGLTYAQTVLCDGPAAYWRFEELDPP